MTFVGDTIYIGSGRTALVPEGTILVADVVNQVLTAGLPDTSPALKILYLSGGTIGEGGGGGDGLSAYQIAVNNGFVGTEEEWLASLGGDGKSAYQIAVDNGFFGTEDQWLASLRGETRVTFDNVDHLVLPTERIIEQTGTLTAVRTVTLPSIEDDALSDGHTVQVGDKSETASLDAPILVTAGAGEAIDGGDVYLNYALAWGRFIADSSAKTWTPQYLKIDPDPALSGGTAAPTSDAVLGAIEAIPQLKTNDLTQFPVETVDDPDNPGTLVTIVDLSNAVAYDTDDQIFPAAVRDPDEGNTVGGTLEGPGYIKIEKNYTQNVPPTDRKSGTALEIRHDAILADTTAFIGSVLAPGDFGPSGMVQLSGDIEHRVSQSYLGFGPIAWAYQVHLHNQPGHSLNFTPGWGIMQAPWFYADNGIVQPNRNDTARGGASFVDNQLWFTQNGGEINSDTTLYEPTSFLSTFFMLGKTGFKVRNGFVYQDVNGQGSWGGSGGTVSDVHDVIQGSVPNLDDNDLTLPMQIGFLVPYLTGADRNFGISNASGLITPPRAVTITAVSDTLPIDATLVAVTATSALALTGNPTIPAGLPGQQVTYRNLGTFNFSIRDDTSGHHSGLRVHQNPEPASGRAPLTIAPGEAVTLVYGTSLWHVLSRTNPARDGIFVPTNVGNAGVTIGSFLGAPVIGMTPDGTSATDPQLLYRQDADWWKLINAGYIVDQAGVGANTQIGSDSASGYVQLWANGDARSRLAIGVNPLSANEPALFMGDGSATAAQHGYLWRVNQYMWAIDGPDLRARIARSIRTVTADTTLTATESQLDVNGSAAIVITVPLLATVPRNVGAVVMITNRGTDIATLTPVSGSVTLESVNGSSLVMRPGETRTLLQRAVNIWQVSGGSSTPTIRSVTADTTVLASDDVILVNNASAAHVTIPLALASSRFMVIKVGGAGALDIIPVSGSVTIDTPGGLGTAMGAGESLIVNRRATNVWTPQYTYAGHVALIDLFSIFTANDVEGVLSELYVKIRDPRVPVVATAASGATLTPTTSQDVTIRTAQAANLTINAPTGTPADGQLHTVRLKSDASIRTLTWNGIFRAPSAGPALPTATVASKTLYCQFMYNAADTKWDLIVAVRDFT